MASSKVAVIGSVICGNDDAAKAEVTSILDEFGWETEDMGPVEVARLQAAEEVS